MGLKPENLSFEEAAAIPNGGLLALHFLKKAGVRGGQKVMIYGASGSIGTSAVQLAKSFGAEVTGVCSTANLELVRSLGADRVVDYTKEDATAGGEKFNVIFDAVGEWKRSKFKEDSKKTLVPGGRYISVDDGSPKGTLENLLLLKELTEKGRLKPVIDRTYALEETVEAHRYVDRGHKKGNVVLTV